MCVLQIIGESLFGQLPRVYGYGMLPSSQRLQYLLSSLSQTLPEVLPCDDKPLESFVSVAPVSPTRSESPTSSYGGSPSGGKSRRRKKEKVCWAMIGL